MFVRLYWLYGCIGCIGCMGVCLQPVELYVCMFVWVYACMFVWLYACMFVWVYACMFAVLCLSLLFLVDYSSAFCSLAFPHLSLVM